MQANKVEQDWNVKVSKLMEANDIEAHLLTFEHVMKAYDVITRFNCQ